MERNCYPSTGATIACATALGLDQGPGCILNIEVRHTVLSISFGLASDDDSRAMLRILGLSVDRARRRETSRIGGRLGR